ncbi:MAG: hypothetical protein M3R00_06730, partial [Pseudomonadota bacterium]|nr:hypothetical protein [Pseudomonadota bacterium]
MKKIIIWSSITLLLIFTLTLTAGYCFLNSTAGSQWLVQKALAYVPGEIKVGKISGQLMEKIRLENIVYRQGDTTVEIDKLTFRWHMIGLLHRKIDVSYFKIANAKVHLANQKAPSSALDFSILSIPDYRLRLRSVNIKHLSITSESNDKPIEFYGMRINAKLSQRTLSMILIAHMQRPDRLNIRLETSGKPSNYEIRLVLD